MNFISNPCIKNRKWYNPLGQVLGGASYPVLFQKRFEHPVVLLARGKIGPRSGADLCG
ncbi:MULTISPECIES: hypothetical protein [Kamptonema]|uniref:hypothetical protein n=1 Tax=Kamptonema TaxID=1501433 RepID=UPI0001DAC1AA|nr:MULTISPECIES: hypothetical protein [Kamptonema]CBN58434.1 hypothetical protein OSCI_3770020 [Kamptonema sp. PCC 6506]